MPRALQSAALSFGLVNIPIKLYPAAHSKSVSFHLLHKPDGSRIQQQFYCPIDHKTVPRDELVKGFEISRNEYVELSDEELKSMEEVANRNVEILEFVPLDAVDPVYFEKTYYLGADKGSEKPYRLLAAALTERNRGAVAKFVMRGKENLVLIRPAGGEHLILDVMFYADEIRNIREIPVPAVKIRETELKLAEQVIDGLSNDKWQPGKYHDTYRERLLKLIEKKSQGEEIVTPPAKATAEVIDLMEALKNSLGRGTIAKTKKPPARALRGENSRRKAAARRVG
jgi:DNA end-binding protein Ku